MLGMFGLSGLSVGVITGSVLAVIAGALLFNTYENAQIRNQTRMIVEAEAEKRTMEAINEVSSKSEQARAKLRYCTDLGQLYDFETDKCIE